MFDTIRDAPLGQLVRYFTGNKTLLYREEQAEFKVPSHYLADAVFSTKGGATPVEQTAETKSQRSAVDSDLNGQTRPPSSVGGDEVGREAQTTEIDLAAIEKGVSEGEKKQRLDDGTVLVTWYDDNDPENPQNWSLGKKIYTAGLVCLYTCSVYMGSSVFSSSIPGVMEHFGVSQQKAALGLSMYVLAYGIGPMLWAPMSEIPVFGRNIPYLSTFTIFVILTVPATLANSFDGIIALRFLLGFFGSPCLANGGATFTDIFSMLYIGAALPSWAFWATVGPSLGPVIAGFAVSEMGWRWSGWIILWATAPVLIAMWISMPETSADNILLKRARRLRKLTGNANLRSESELKQAAMKPREIAVEALWRPIQLIVLDPSIAFTAVYISLVYGIFYSFFEAFPVVYGGIYGMSSDMLGLTFLSTSAGVIISLTLYLTYIIGRVIPNMKNGNYPGPEDWLRPALVATWFAPIGLFIFGWTARESIHWIVSLVGVTIFAAAVFTLFQCVFMYLAVSYQKYTASLFAGNDFARSFLAAGAVHFATPLFHNLGVGPSASLLGGLTVLCIGGIYILFYMGPTLRARSRFADT